MEIFSVPMLRADVIAAHGDEAKDWGFKICAPLPPNVVDHTKLALRFGDSLVVEAPETIGATLEAHDFFKLTQTFFKRSKAGDRILEIGSRARSGGTNRHLVHPDVDYVGMDITAGPNVDVVGDAHHLSRHVEGEFDAIFSVSVFEHLLMPWMVALEMNKVLKDGGIAYIQSHAAWPIHDAPWDFWRFSKDSWNGLFNEHTGFEVLGTGVAMRCRFVPECMAIAHIGANFDSHGSHLASGCLIQKTGPAKVVWAAEASDVYNLSYDHS